MTTLTELLETPPRDHHEVEVSPGAVQATLDCLGSPGAMASVARVPYWPKWDSPWWHMALLHELGLSPLIPAALAQAMAAALPGHYLPTFPLVEREIPAGIDPYRQILCNCALGSRVQALAACGRPIDEALPGARAWFLRYQLPDGGLNCDEAAYTRPSPHSSMVSTLPALEAMLGNTEGPFTPEETAFLDAGANDLLQRRLCRSLSKGALIDESWLTPTLPPLLRIRRPARLEVPGRVGAAPVAPAALERHRGGRAAPARRLPPGHRRAPGLGPTAAHAPRRRPGAAKALGGTDLPQLPKHP